MCTRPSFPGRISTKAPKFMIRVTLPRYSLPTSTSLVRPSIHLIAATSGEAAQKAIKWIEGLTKDVEVGKEYLGKVTRIMNFGAFVEILPGKEGLVHISQLADYRVPRVEDVVSIGDELMVIVTEIDRMGRVNLSRRAAMERHMAKAGVTAGSTTDED